MKAMALYFYSIKSLFLKSRLILLDVTCDFDVTSLSELMLSYMYQNKLFIIKNKKYNAHDRKKLKTSQFFGQTFIYAHIR